MLHTHQVSWWAAEVVSAPVTDSGILVARPADSAGTLRPHNPAASTSAVRRPLPFNGTRSENASPRSGPVICIRGAALSPSPSCWFFQLPSLLLTLAVKSV